MSVTIRAFDGSHADVIGPFINGIQRNEFQVPVTLDDQPDLKDIRKSYQSGDGNFWIATDGETLVGTIGMIDAGNGIGVLRKMFVHSDYRGKEKGVAQKLLETLMMWAKDKGFAELYLGTLGKLKAAEKFYLRNHFKLTSIDTLPEEVARIKMKVDTHYYHRELAA